MTFSNYANFSIKRKKSLPHVLGEIMFVPSLRKQFFDETNINICEITKEQLQALMVLKPVFEEGIKVMNAMIDRNEIYSKAIDNLYTGNPHIKKFKNK